MYYRIAGLLVHIDGINNILNHNWRKFLTVKQSEEYINVQICTKENEYYLLEKYELFHMERKENWLCFRYDKDILLVDSEWKEAKILSLHCQEAFDMFVNQVFTSVNVKKRMLQLHSSLIATNEDQGIMFLGPSGIGKTTQAELWAKYCDALIINGDVVFVQETEHAFLGWGTPWHGSSPYCENTNVPVHTMIVLKQSPENSIRELTGFEKVTAVSQSVFYPRWLENGMELCLETLDHLLTKVPVYELSCRPDEDAVRLTEEAVFGKAVI